MGIITHGIRHDEPHLFERSEVLSGRDAMQRPYLVIVDASIMGESWNSANSAVVTQVRDIADLLEYPDAAVVLWTWPGKDRSDYFRFTVGEFRAAHTARREAARQARILDQRQQGLPNAGD